MILYTDHYSSRHPARLDITRAGCDKALRVGKPAPGAIFAPSADLLRWGLDARNRARGDAERMAAVWARYEADYLAEVRERIAADRAALDALLRLPEACAVCFCGGADAAAGHCHRFPAARLLAEYGADYRGEWKEPVRVAPQMDLFGGGK